MSAFIPVEALSSLSQQAQALVAAANAQSLQGAAPVMAGDSAAPVAGAFGQLVSDGLSRINGQLIGSQVDLQKLATGDAQNLHQIMINLEESRVSFQLMMQVRNRLLEAYQDIMKMPI
jgi:flagellar hook-basal body complex protein FliE